MRAFAERVVTLFQAIHPLDRVPRAGFVLRGVTEPESVSAHSHFVAVLALLFTQAYPERWNRERVLAMAIVHDLPEARLMDIAMPYADAYLKDAKHQAEQAICDHLFESFSCDCPDLHREFAEARTPEAQLLRGLDKAQMMLKVLNYDQEQRGRLAEFWENPKNFNDYGIEAVSALFDLICERAGKPRPRQPES